MPETKPAVKPNIEAATSKRSLIWYAAIVQTNRIKLTIIHLQVSLIFDINDGIWLGRQNDSKADNIIDLAPFGAFEMGVSRQHLAVRWVDDHVVVVDNASLNASWLNGELMTPRIAYPLYQHDNIAISIMQLRFEFLD